MNALDPILKDVLATVARAVEQYRFVPEVCEVGRVAEIGDGIARVRGLPGVQSEEMLEFPHGRKGMAVNLDPGEVGVIMLDHAEDVEAGAEVWRSGRVIDVPVGDALLGRVVDPTGRPLDKGEGFAGMQRWPVERPVPAIHDRAPVEAPMESGLKIIDALVPIGRGQRQLILGDRQTGKTSIAIDTIRNQSGKGVICVYCAIGQRSSALSGCIAELEAAGALDYTTVVATTAEDPAGLQFIAPYAATSIAEFWAEQGRDVLIVYDDLTRHAWAYRELSLLLRRPPGREAYPGDIFYIHSRLLERATHLKPERNGGSLTALPIAETQAQNLAGYITTNLISITDGQIYLSPVLQQRGLMPAVDVGLSVSRVGGKAQPAAYRAITGDLRLSHAQFEELERFSRYGARLDDERRAVLDHGARIRAVLKQPKGHPLSAAEQIAILSAATRGHLDEIPLAEIADAERAIRDEVIASGESFVSGAFDDAARETLEAIIDRALARHLHKEDDGNT